MFPGYHRLTVLLGREQGVWQLYNPTQQAAGLVLRPAAAGLAETGLRFCTASEAFDRPQNEAFAAALRSLGIPFECDVLEGTHDTSFVLQHIGDHFQFHRRAFAHSAS
jgi:S-formylglutathione hydrolase FrmB